MSANEIYVASVRNQRIFRRCNYFRSLNDKEFRMRFRLTKKQFQEVLQQIEHGIRQRKMICEISPVIQLLVAIRFYATGCFLQVAADFCCISTKSAQRIVHRVSAAIANLFHRYVSLPRTDEEIIQTAKDNFLVSGMIRVIGAIDCVHVRIRSYEGSFGDQINLTKNIFTSSTTSSKKAEMS
ncbi:putative nuclease HARBI1 [Prorops nasuta]|uniref:putative nuclease HARBI1 n=1 Tax=Prorops nasuta TaxID=863751 RepID=UPI0034CE4D0D